VVHRAVRAAPGLPGAHGCNGFPQYGGTSRNGGETGGEPGLAEPIQISLLERRISDLKTMLDDMRTQRDDMRGQRDAWQRQAETSQRALTDQREKSAPQ
jgi:hypothetical protein